MKRYGFILPALILLAATLTTLVPTGCGVSDNPTGSADSTYLSTFSVMLNGTLWNADSAECRIPDSGPYAREIDAWQGNPLFGEVIFISLRNYAPGVYTFSDSSDDYLLAYSTALRPFYATEGSVTITTSNDDYIEGRFEFNVVTDGRILYEGHEGNFKAYYHR